MTRFKTLLVFAILAIFSTTFIANSQSHSSKKTAAKPTSAATEAKPAAPAVTPEVAKQIFQKRCVVCHGADGKGNKTIAPKAPDFSDAKWQARHKEAVLINAVSNGIGQGKGSMPSWKKVLNEGEIKALVAHVRTFAKKQK
ncbi:MAG: c-type cytochrome [Blastocatellia bacterium]|nr:c-type cytochrome [Blastocatellia bacterium]